MNRLLYILMMDHSKHNLSEFEKNEIIKLLDSNTLLLYKNWLQSDQKQLQLNQIKNKIQKAQKQKNIYDLSTSSQCIPFSEKNYIRICKNNQKPTQNFPNWFKNNLLHFCSLEIAKNYDFFIQNAQEYIDLT
jgi:hypothetical protein